MRERERGSKAVGFQLVMVEKKLRVVKRVVDVIEVVNYYHFLFILSVLVLWMIWCWINSGDGGGGGFLMMVEENISLKVGVEEVVTVSAMAELCLGRHHHHHNCILSY